jgi:hypothetical protein
MVARALRPTDLRVVFTAAACRSFLHRARPEAAAGSGTGRRAIAAAVASRVRRAPLRTLKTVGLRRDGEHGLAIGRSPDGMRNAWVSSTRTTGSAEPEGMAAAVHPESAFACRFGALLTRV